MLGVECRMLNVRRAPASPSTPQLASSSSPQPSSPQPFSGLRLGVKIGMVRYPAAACFLPSFAGDSNQVHEQRMKTNHTKLFAFGLLSAAIALTLRAAEGYKDTPLIPGTKWHVHDSDRPHPRILAPGASFSHGAPPPADAVALFDGKDFSKWQTPEGGEVKWKIENGYMETTKTGRIRTKDEFGDFQLHLEFATPSKVEGSGQGRGNNGVNIYGRYEIQVLDSYNNVTYADGQAGALYGQTPPLVNASRSPGQWQTYDIIFEGARWDEKGEIIRKASVTLLHNGVVVHNKREL